MACWYQEYSINLLLKYLLPSSLLKFDIILELISVLNTFNPLLNNNLITFLGLPNNIQGFSTLKPAKITGPQC